MFNYLAEVIQWRMDAYFHHGITDSNSMPELPDEWLDLESTLSHFIQTYQLDLFEQLTVLMALVPHLQPNFFDQRITAQLPQPGDYPEIGGWRGEYHRGFLPTGQTVLFILGGNQFSQYSRFRSLFSNDHVFSRKRVLYLDSSAPGEPLMSGKLIMTQDYVDLFTQGCFFPSHFSIDFPAQRITTAMTWEDVVLSSETLQQIQELKAWLIYKDILLKEWGMKKKLQLGYKSLFYGPPGTGKTLTATLLAKETKKDIYRIDLSVVISKYIGETEKNLATLFAQAENKDWILFFDEADALFGKRTNVQNAHDRYANQEVSYLLQRIENYDGLVILASNFKSNIDEAFIRRFQSMIYFPIPNQKERQQIWKMAFPEQVTLDQSVDLSSLSANYELTGADIMNIVQYCCIQSLDRGDRVICQDDLLYAIKREFSKSGKVI